MPTYRLDWKNWADGKASVNVFRISDGVLIATHGGTRAYLWNLIVKRGFNK
jgi:hypothetical protein